MRTTKLLILAGGFGTRLKSTVADVPKALAPTGSVPFLQLQIEHWLKQGLRDFTFLLHHQADQIISFLQAQKESLLKECQVNWVIEHEPLGTGGAVANAVKQLNLKENFLLTNADTWLTTGINQMIQSTAPAIAAVKLSDVSRYGKIHFDEHNNIMEFVEKNLQSEPGWINAGLCHFSTWNFQEWNGKPFSLEREFFANMINKRELSVVLLKTEFIDIGVPEDFYRFCGWIKADRKRIL
jgi:D-glycero-alpha-D-manno-heptose 1-phosphate guanylyltransferase